MMARITLIVFLVAAISILHNTAFGQQYQVPQTRQQYPQPAGPQRYTQQPAQSPAQTPAQSQYRGSAGQTVPQGASAIVPQNTPRLERRVPQTVQAPFQLTSAQQAEVDRVLKRWEDVSKTHKRIVIEFNRFEFKPALASAANPNAPLHVDQGRADFTSSGKWMWSIRGEWVGSKVVEGQRAEKMLFDGESIYEFDYAGKVVNQHILSEDMQGEDMVRAMLPFLFGTDMNELKRRYFIRLSKAPNEGQICIDAWPRFLDEARNYKSARMIVDWAKMEPTGLRLVLPNGTDSYSYEFTEVDINPKNPLDPLNLLSDPFKVKVPSGWTTHVEKLADTQVSSRPANGPTR